MDQALFKRMQEAALRFRAGASDVEEIETPNGLARLVRDPTNPMGFRIDFVGEAARRSVPIQEYPPSPVRLPGYPAPLPFLPHCAATVDTAAQTVTWRDPPEDADERVASECAADGWTRVDVGGSPAIYEKNDVERTVRWHRDDVPSRLIMHEGPKAPRSDG